ncbi:hypothetical protein BG015_006798 [Linnemannia schmuckeri]|uniref:Uncharacterized protein n=1 Tax=Linnemannia schmuckeri TaxID=64567 RepID=A0A9P5S2Y1_9FUNG|nr:hypothetical protein BG015_006798 [Linnemannia schmuckeri]
MDHSHSPISYTCKKQPSFSQWTLPPKMRFGLLSLFLIWLCITLLFATAHTGADIVRPNGVNRVEQFDMYFEGTECTVRGDECCSDRTSVECQGWFCINGQCAALRCEQCIDDQNWFCGRVEGVTRDHGMACKHRAYLGQTCDNTTMPCMNALACVSNNNTCQYTPEYQKEHEEEVKSRRITMVGMIVVLIAMFAAMRKMLKNEEARRRQIWEPVDSSAEASILRRLAEDTQRRVAGGWGQISESLVEGGNAATAAVGTAFTRIRNNVRSATGGSRPEDCDDNLEMMPNGRRAQTRRELEADMRDFLLEADDEEEDEDQIRDEDGLLARHRNSSSSGSSGGHPRQTAGGSNTISSTSPPLPSLHLAGSGGDPTGFPDEPPSYDEIRPSNNQGAPSSIAAGLNITSQQHLTSSSGSSSSSSS